jgi:hypothetical protein
MRTNARKVPTQFEAETAFAVPVPAVPSRGMMERELEALKDRVWRELRQELPNPEFHAPLRRAVNEAAALAWLTPYPLLFLPLLAEEKARREQQLIVRQREIRDRTVSFMPQAA